jgi:chromosome partitioning protein
VPVVVIASQKGGSGKTTLATCLADAFAAEGERVLLIDTDPQRSALAWGEAHTGAVVVIGATANNLSRPRLTDLSRAYSLVIIDTPPRLGEATRAAFAVADVIVIPSRPTSMDVATIPATIEAAVLSQAPKMVVITQRPSRSASADTAPAAIRAGGIDVAGASLGFRTDYPDAHSQGQGVCSYAPTGKAAAEVQALIVELRALLSPPSVTTLGRRGKR